VAVPRQGTRMTGLSKARLEAPAARLVVRAAAKAAAPGRRELGPSQLRWWVGLCGGMVRVMDQGLEAGCSRLSKRHGRR